MSEAFQDGLPWNHCWGCGPANPEGLHLKSRWDEAEAGVAVARFAPRAYQMAGPEHVLNGGIIATLIDCHGICTAVADAYARAGRPIGSEPRIWFATGSLSVTYVRPAPIEAELLVRGRVTEAGERKTVVACTVSSAGEERALGEVVAVRVPPDWLHGPGNPSVP